MDLPLYLLLPLLAAAWIGHAFLWTVALNWWYAQALPRSILKVVRSAIALLVFSFPIVMVFLVSRPLDDALSVYLILCAAVSVIYLPIISLVRARRRPPSEVASNTSYVVDMAARLGDKPIGDGKHWRLACLPRNQVFQVEFRTLTLRLTRLPAAWEGLTILHVSDIHLCGTPGRPFYTEIFDEAMRAGTPDILAITGDVIDSAHHHRWILPLIERLKWTIASFAVLGNHDSYYDPNLVRRRLNQSKVTVLGNRNVTIDVRGEPLAVIGNETPWFRPTPSLDSLPKDVFRLCLSHTPDNFAWARRNGIDLILAGHVHGGQIRLPGVGPLFVPSRYSRRYDCGQFAAGPTVMSVSRGLSGGEPLRYNCRPEITRIVLSRFSSIPR